MSNISTVRSIDRKQHRPVVVISSIDHKPKVTVKTGETKRKPRKSKPEVVQLDLPVVEKPPRTTKKRSPAVVAVPVKTIKEVVKK